MHEKIWFFAAVWMGLALIGSLVPIWIGISIATTLIDERARGIIRLEPSKLSRGRLPYPSHNKRPAYIGDL